MDRRGFLRLAAAGAVAATLRPGTGVPAAGRASGTFKASVRCWYFLGPVPCTNAAEFNAPTAVEHRTVDFSVPTTISGRQLWWKPGISPGDHIDLYTRYFPDIVNYYAYGGIRVFASEATPATASVGVDNVMRLFVNGKLEIDYSSGGAATPGQRQVQISFRKGWNTILVKVWNLGGPWGYFMELESPIALQIEPTETQVPHISTGRRNVAFWREKGVAIQTSNLSCGQLELGQGEPRDGPHRLIDGRKFTPGADANSLCWSSDPYHHLPCWIWIGFAGYRRINRVVLYAGEMTLQPVEFFGQMSGDSGVTFQELFHVNNARFDPVTLCYIVDFEPVDTDNFRLLITRSAAPETPQSHWAQLSEVEIYGDNAPGKSGLPIKAAERFAIPVSSLHPDVSFSPQLHDDGRTLDIQTPWYRIQLDKTSPRITYLSWDSLGERNVDVNFLRDSGGYPRLERVLHGVNTVEAASLTHAGNVFQYAPVSIAPGVLLRLAIKTGLRDFDMELTVLADRKVAMQGGVFRFDFAPNQTPATFVCHPATVFNYVPTPCYLHAPDWGTAFITCEKADTCFYRSPAIMFIATEYHIEIAPQIPTRPDRLGTLAAGTWQETIHFEIDTIRPLPELTQLNPRLHRLPAYALNITQWRPDTGFISNSVASINCGLAMLFYAEMAAFSPPLKAGISAMELVRASLQRYFDGAPGYLMPPSNVYAAQGNWRSSRETPAYLIICAWYVIRTIGGLPELWKSLRALECIAGDIESWSTDGLAYQGKVPGFNHGWDFWFDVYIIRGADAYSNAANYRAFRCLAELENLAGRPAMAKHYHQNADRIQKVYMKTFFNPATGVLAGWRDNKGQLHDYMFPWVNGFAIYQGLVSERAANAILDRLLAQIKKVGFKSYHLGLPTNLLPIHPSDYVKNVGAFPRNPSGTDTWQQYMNGSACPVFVYYVIQSLYILGRRNEAEELLWPLVESFGKGTFNAGVQMPKYPQRNPVGSAFYLWNGSHASGEGYLPENWQAMAAIFTGHYGIRLDDHGYRLEPWSPLRGKKTKLGLPFMGKVVEAIE